MLTTTLRVAPILFVVLFLVVIVAGGGGGGGGGVCLFVCSFARVLFGVCLFVFVLFCRF